MYQNLAPSNYNTDSQEAGWDAPLRAQKLVEQYIVDGAKVASLGAGTGLDVAGYAEKGATVYALDHDPAMLEIAKDVIGEQGSVRQADINEVLPLDDVAGEIDVVQSIGALEFAEDLPNVFAQVHDALKSGGVFVFTAELLDNVTTTEAQTHYAENDITVYRHTPDDIAAMLERTGFVIESAENFDGYQRGDGMVPYGLFLARKQ